MAPTSANGPRPLLIYDGDCGFCNYWAKYWQKLTGESVDYAPYQEVAGQYPDITPEAFRRAVQYIAPDGKTASAAEASFLTLSHARGKGFWLALYRKLPGFAAVSEVVYAFIAAHRPIFHRFSLWLWGRDYAPPRYDNVAWLFLRLFGLIYLAAFLSFGSQALGLIGSEGILPLQEFTGAVKAQLGSKGYWYLPMVFWLDASDTAIRAVCWAGAGFSVLLTLGILPRLSLFILYALYLSLMYAGQVFMNYQWDAFLVETGFLALLMSFSTRPGIWLMRWLLFRFMFMSGAVKLLSGDTHWADLSALSYHFLTQPLPTPLAWYAAQLPVGVLTFATGLVFLVELVLPFFIFFPRHLRFVAAFSIVLLETCIFLTGNYNFFNLHNMLLCLVLFDDAALKRLLPERMMRVIVPRAREYALNKVGSYAVGMIAALLVFCSVVQMSLRFGHEPPAAMLVINNAIAPLRIINSYGLFAVMTVKREEIIIEGSNDGVEWKEYGFIYKPGDIHRAPLWNIPHQPRLDWQMWFASLDSPQRLPWFSRFLEKILKNSPPVMVLMAHNPFPDTPPLYIRAQFYDYTYASPTDKAQGIWWHRDLLGSYFPQASLTTPQ